MAKSNRKVDEPVASKDDIEVTPSMQKSVAKKLASIIDNQIQFVDSREATADEVNDAGDDEGGFGIRLFSNSAAPVTILNPENTPVAHPKKANTRPAIRKRIRDPSPDEATKLAEAVVDASYILDQIEVRGWHRNQKRLDKNLDLYNLRNGSLFPVEPINEFTKLKRKNNWDEKKIHQKIKRQAHAPQPQKS